jgi:hypothetical protein
MGSVEVILLGGPMVLCEPRHALGPQAKGMPMDQEYNPQGQQRIRKDETRQRPVTEGSGGSVDGCGKIAAVVLVVVDLHRQLV